MMISLNWINDYVNLKDIDIDWLIHKITTTTAEIEETASVDGDTLLEIDNKSLTHRPDLWCHYGFAREIAAITGRPLKPIDVISEEELRKTSGAPLQVSIDSPDLCLRYSAIRLAGVSPIASPPAIVQRLTNCGLKSINLLVDLANYVMLDIGQPLHAFDAKYMSNIRVYNTECKTKFTALDGVERELPEGSLIIGGNEPAAIAGIIGGDKAAVSEVTEGIILESAAFDAIQIRKTASVLGLRTDASMRYEKFLDPALTVPAIGRYAKLLLSYIPEASISSPLYDSIQKPAASITINLAHRYIETYLGNNIKMGTVIQILESLGFKAEDKDGFYDVKVPSYRATKDITTKVDLIEEILRVYGYDHIKSVPYKMPVIPVAQDPMKHMENVIKDLMVKCFDYQELHCYSWYDNDWLKRIGSTAEDQHILRIVNSGVKQFEKLRTDLTPNMLQHAYNNKNTLPTFKIFEIGRTYMKSDSFCEQPKHLCALTYEFNCTDGGKKAFMDMKGICSRLLSALKHCEPSFELSSAALPWVHPQKQLSVSCRIDNSSAAVPVGYIYSVPSSLQKLFKNKCSIVILDLNLALLNDIPETNIVYEPGRRYPETYLDFSLLTAKDMYYSNIEKVVKSFTDPYLTSVHYIDTYSGETIPEGMKSTTVRLKIGSNHKTLSLEEIDCLKEKFISYLRNFSITIR